MTPLFREMERISQRFTTKIRGITVVKTVWANDEGLSVVRFEISSDRDDPVHLRIVESVPDGFPMENLGPHPKYGGGKWTKTENRTFVYTDRLESGGETFTLYGIKELSSTTLESFLTDAVVDIDPASDEPANDSDDSPTMTDDETETSGLDDDNTEQEEDFTRGGGGSFDDRIPRVEDLGSVPGGWGAGRPRRESDSSNIQFVGSKAQSTENRADTQEQRTPMELEDPTQPDDDSEDSEAETDDSDVEPEDPEAEAEAGPSATETAESVESAAADSDAVDSEDESSAVDVEGDDGDVEPDTEDEATPEADSADDAEVNDTTDDEEVSSESTSDDEAHSDDEPTTEGDDSIVDALVAELSERDLSDRESELLREALGVSAPTSVDVRLRHVQNRVDDLAAYTTALESFLDENGTAEQVIEDLQTETEAMRGDIEDLESALSASKEAIKLVEQQVTAIEDRMVDEATFEERLDELDGKLVSESELEAELDGLTTDLAEIREDVETGKVWRSNLSQAIQLPGMMDDGTDETESPE